MLRALPSRGCGRANVGFIIGTGVDHTPLDAVPTLRFVQKLRAGKPIV